MTVARAQIRIPRDNAITEDIVTNTLYWHSVETPLLESDCADIAATINLFYGAWDQYLNKQLNPSGAEIRFYDMADPEPRVPVSIEPLSLTPGTGDPGLPAEVAACLSFRGAVPSGANRARRTGRIYLGPFTTGVLQIGTGDADISDTFAGFVDDGLDFLTTPVDNGGRIWTWCVYSPSTVGGGSNPNLGAFDVETVWMDERFDTQRRRGSAPTRKIINRTV